MKGFIEYKERDEGLRVLRAVESIVCVLQSPGGEVFIQTGTSKKDEPVGDFVDGTFEEVKKKFKTRCNKKGNGEVFGICQQVSPERVRSGRLLSWKGANADGSKTDD